MIANEVRLIGDTTQNLESSNRIFQTNELIIEHTSDGSFNIKMGNGKVGWNDLKYVYKEETVNELIKKLGDIESLLQEV